MDPCSVDFASASEWRRCRYASLGRAQAGVLFVRPCAAVAAHMLALASDNPLLQFPLHDAEQDFLNWCDTCSQLNRRS